MVKKLSEKTKLKISNSHKGRYYGKNNPFFGKQIGKYRGTFYSMRNQNPWTRVWQTQIWYKGKSKSLGYFNDPISGQIVHDFVKKEIYRK